MRNSPLVAITLAGLFAYKHTLSPVFYSLGLRCRHAPSCADYAAESFRRHGAHRGFWLSLSRVSRCHPWGSHGVDPVPDRLGGHGWRIWRYGDWAWTERNSD